MDSDDWESTWTKIEEVSNRASNSFADASMSCLSQKKPLQALHNLLEGWNWFSLRAEARSDSRSGVPPKIDVMHIAGGLDTVRGVLDPETTAAIEDGLARKDAEASAASDANIAQKLELEQYSTMTVQALHGVFYESGLIPCNCTNQEQFAMTQYHACVLRLDGGWQVPGNSSDRFFECVLAKDDNYEWKKIQFRIPRKNTHVTFGSHDRENDPDLHSNDENVGTLQDFCTLLDDSTYDYVIPVQLKQNEHNYSLYQLTAVPMNGPPEDHLNPITVSEAIRRNLLSAKSKISLAFALSKWFWQFYSSDWMQSAWNFDTVVLLRQNPEYPSLNVEARTPCLLVDARSPEQPVLLEYQQYDRTGRKLISHRYPHILNLGLLLILVCTKRGSPDKSLNTLDTKYFFCKNKLKGKEWPQLDISEKIKETYRNVVQHCFPEPRKEICLDLHERRQMLLDKIVRPLYDLLQTMEDPIGDELLSKGNSCIQHYGEGNEGTDEVGKTPSQTSDMWINNIIRSALYNKLEKALKPGHRARPKIALIDTGYDPKASFLRRRSCSNRLNPQYDMKHIRYHWRDFCDEKSPRPLDVDGHGTSMLSLLMKLAPFAEICVARIARSDSDLMGQKASISQERLADAIKWAVEVHNIDVISMSFGWDDECLVNGKYVVRDAISNARSARSQNILFFASASNYGGGKDELFPARESQVFSIRGTDYNGKHCDFNASLPREPGTNVYGTLGEDVPTAQRGGSEEAILRTGTSPATAIAAGIAAVVIGYIDAFATRYSWQHLRTMDGFQKLLSELSTEPEVRKRFLTLENVYHDLEKFNACLDAVSSKSRTQ